MRNLLKKVMKRKPVGKLRLSKPVFKDNTSKNTYLNYNWKQTKARFKGINPMGDLDLDGTRNKFDCRPFDPARDGKFSDFLKRAGKKIVRVPERTVRQVQRRIKGRVQRMTPRNRKPVTPAIRRGATKVIRVLSGEEGVTSTTRGKKKYTTAGRPRESYKHRDPITGRPIPATEFYKIRRRLRKKASVTAEGQDIRQQQVLARRGISPEEARAVEIMRLQRIAQLQAQRTLQQPQEVQIQRFQQMRPARITSMQYQDRLPMMRRQARIRQFESQPPQFRVETDILTGRRSIRHLPRKERWTYA